MGIEIERKFLLAGDDWRGAAHEVVPMAQGYLNDLHAVESGAMNASVRVRIEGDQARLNIKSREPGASRQEFDYPIPMADARALLALCVGFWTGGAATSFRKVAETKDEDVWHLMNAVNSLRSMYGLLRTIILGSLVLAIVGLGLVAFGLMDR